MYMYETWLKTALHSSFYSLHPDAHPIPYCGHVSVSMNFELELNGSSESYREILWQGSIQKLRVFLIGFVKLYT